MTYYGYNSETKHLFASNKGIINYLGLWSNEQAKELGFNDVPNQKLFGWKDNTCVVSDERLSIWLASFFLSGLCRSKTFALNYKSDAIDSSLLLFSSKIDPSLHFPFKYSEDFIKRQSEDALICLSGSILASPQSLYDFSMKYPNSQIFAPYKGIALCALGVLLSRMMEDEDIRPRKIQFTYENINELPFESNPYENLIDLDDLGGRMAHITTRSPVLSQVYAGIGDSEIINSVFSKPEGNQDGCYFIHWSYFENYFEAPLSSKMIARTIPIQVPCKEKFAKETKSDKHAVSVRIIDDTSCLLMKSFLSFYEKLNGRKVFISQKIHNANLPNKIPCFRRNKGYLIPKENINEFNFAV